MIGCALWGLRCEHVVPGPAGSASPGGLFSNVQFLVPFRLSKSGTYSLSRSPSDSSAHESLRHAALMRKLKDSLSHPRGSRVWIFVILGCGITLNLRMATVEILLDSF